MKRTRFIVVVCLVALFASCNKGFEISGLSLKKKMDQKMSELSEMAELGTVEYTITKIVKASDDKSWYQFGDRKILFNCTAYLKAGIDMTQFDASKVEVNEQDKSVKIVLPHAKLLSFNMPPEKAVVAYEHVSTFRANFSASDRNHLLQLGEKEIREDVPNLGILEDAEKNASAFFKLMLRQMGFETVTVKFE